MKGLMRTGFRCGFPGLCAAGFTEQSEVAAQKLALRDMGLMGRSLY